MIKPVNLQGDQIITHVISAEESSDRTLFVMQNFSIAISRMKRLLEAGEGWQYELYTSESNIDDCWDMVEQDLLKGSDRIEVVAQIYEFLESRSFSLLQENVPFYTSKTNHLFLYPQWGTALARVPVMRRYGIDHEDVIFAVDDQLLKEFLADMKRRRRALDREQVTVFTDGHDGTQRKLEPITVMVEREEVLMASEVKHDIFRSIDRFFEEDRSFFETFNIPYKRGILLYGKPGNGKTTLVKSIAGSVKAPVAYWQITEHTCSDTIEEVFEAAAAMAPMVLVVEDIDSMPERARSYFLNTLDGATSKEGIFLIGTTNYPEKIDPALMNRAGRFDRAYEIKLPDVGQRGEYLHRKGMPKLLEVGELEELARLTEGFSFAQLNELYVSAAMEWYEERTLNVPRLVSRLKADLHKGRTQEWFQDQTGGRVGFAAI
ncbi:hypothetical protein FHS18_004089 [Paenibacillus phyllosphaerae]|uniref:AAA+ ATPase domain-containing protein n=1 Tax=Paenibacillus phyllosphaerae TaxID=274593 RepID=A0A7W5B1K9_9BACL|nr:ATP-binding protein [Paenibacillus phyllosphaerae]MBB3112011.1 hypothetical protein [Paenibacillus phyllosphaerae]